mmetsp:Transcript_19734/g.62674  ORF Transcript_19734/g.62674 Transcript_19734/m.62674 type:complete len:139 (-) Transcript_19734:23-439(-)
MSEAKGGEQPTVEVTKLDASPNDVPVENPLRLQIQFTTDRPIPDAHWAIKYIVDTVSRRHVVQLGESKETDYAKGDNEMNFSVDKIDVSGVGEEALGNTGILTATLLSRGTEVVDVNIVVQVVEEGGAFIRCFLNPLE